METFGQTAYPASAGYPASFTVDPADRITNWKPFVQWLLAIPHHIVLYLLGIVSQVVGIIAWFAILITGTLPESLGGLQSLYIRYMNRVYSYVGFLREEYPPFTFETTYTDPNDYPARTELTPELQDRNRLTVFFRLILAIPHLFVLTFLGIAAFVVAVIAAFVVLFTGTWPDGMRSFIEGVLRWNTRFYAYFLLLTDEYPPFSLD